MKKFKSFMILAVCITLFGSLLAACNGNNAGNAGGKSTTNAGITTDAVDSEDPYKEHIEISVAFWDIDAEMQKAIDDPIFQEVMKKFNITIKPVNTTWDDYAQKIQMWAASDQLPDIFAIDAVGTQNQRKWIEQGVVKALPDLTAYPNLAQYFESPDIKGLAVDGKHFAIPRRQFPSVDWSALDRVVAYRWDLAQKAGITKEPETWDEFNAMLEAIVTKDPDNTKITGITTVQTKMIGGLFWLYGNPAATSDGSGADFKWIKEDGKFVPAVFSNKALPAVQNMRDMYDKKLIDPDIALTKPDIAYDKFVSGKSAAILMGGGFVNTNLHLYEKRWKSLFPDKNFTENVKILKPLTGPDGEKWHAVFKNYWSESYISNKVDEKKLDRIMRLYDYILSPEGKELLNYGKKDVDYKVEGDKKVSIGDQTMNQKYPALGFLRNLVAYEAYEKYTMEDPTIGNMEIREEAVSYIDWILKNTKLPEYDIRLTYMSTPTKDKFSVLDHDDLLKVMLADEPVDVAWNKIVEGYKAKGLDKMIEEVNAKAKEQGIE